MRGEQGIRKCIRRNRAGSPPLARGTALFSRSVYPDYGITPACAGNRVLYHVNRVVSWDHPRLRGEQEFDNVLLTDAEGSPPLARGTVYSTSTDFSGHRITPACAGNSPCKLHHTTSLWDHPRLRGEQYISSRLTAARSGSPPLARGTDQQLQVSGRVYGITPACAGNS